MKSATWNQIPDEANTFGEGMNPSAVPNRQGSIKDQYEFSGLGKATSLGEKKFWIQTTFIEFKN